MRRLAQFCINVTDLDKSEKFYVDALGLVVENRFDFPELKESLLVGDTGNAETTRLQLAHKLDREGPIVHGDALMKFYHYSDDIKGVYEKAMTAGAENIMEPTYLEQWNVTAAQIKDPDGYTIQLMERHSS